MLLYACGSNARSQLSIEQPNLSLSPEDVARLERVNIPIAPTDQIIDIACGGNHTAVRTLKGEVFVAGSLESSHSISKIANSQGNICYFSHMESGISRLACGWQSIFLVKEDYPTTLFCYGNIPGVKSSNADGKSRYESTFEFPSEIRSISCAIQHLVVVLENGHAWGIGGTTSNHHRLGNSYNPKNGMQQLFLAEGFIENVVTSPRSSLIISNTSNGVRSVCRLRSNETIMIESLNKKIMSVQCSWRTDHVLLSNGELHSWGHRLLSKRHDMSEAHHQCVRDVNGEPLRIQVFAAGSEHVLALTTDNRLLVWGWNEHGNCSSDLEILNEPQQLDIPGSCKYIAAGCATSWVYILPSK